MELVEQIDVLNKRLRDHYGVDTVTGQPMWRIVWSDDQYEMRLTDCTPEGLTLLVPEMKLLPKYSQWIHQKYILERLVEVPLVNEKELTTKINYEPIFIYEDKNYNYLPPKWEVTKFTIDCVLAAMGRSSMANYTEDTSAEAQQARIEGLEKELFGNETATGDALAHKEGVTVPTNYNKGNENV